MQEVSEEEENLTPQDRSEVTTGAARLGAALPVDRVPVQALTSTDLDPTNATHNPDGPRVSLSTKYITTQLLRVHHM